MKNNTNSDSKKALYIKELYKSIIGKMSEKEVKMYICSFYTSINTISKGDNLG
jgi:DNA-directed RNA polymerase delta subunit